MLDIKKLERRWLKYKIKSFIPYFIILLIFLLLSGFFYWFKSQASTRINTKSAPPSKTIQATSQKVLPLVVDENTTLLEPSMNFIQSFQDSTGPNEISTSATSIQKTTTPQMPPIPTTLKTVEYSPGQTTVPAASRLISDDKSLSIKRDDTKLDINELQRRFKETSNANLALFISRYYYEHGDYNEAYNYALKTNNLNNRIDESWILFSKSLVKLGKTDQAKKTLQLYISQSNSDAAKTLLENIERGNFK